MLRIIGGLKLHWDLNKIYKYIIHLSILTHVSKLFATKKKYMEEKKNY
jgi:hypothetical protein